MKMNIEDITKDLGKLEKEISAAEKEITQAEAKRDLLQKQGEQYGVSNATEAANQIKENEEKKKSIAETIQDKYSQLKELYEW